MLKTEIVFCGRSVMATCDQRCDKAWGVNGRRHFKMLIDYDGEDDIAYLADNESGIAPDDPGTYEGGHGKPTFPKQHNKWCVRECERCEFIAPGEPIRIRDFFYPFYNIPSAHGLEDNHFVDTGEVYHGPVER